MTTSDPTITGAWISGFQATLALWGWTTVVVLHGFFWRSLSNPQPDRVRSSGPIY